MPTTIVSPSPSNTSMRYQEPYTSAGLNRKMLGIIPNGIVRGGQLQTSGSGFLVQVDPDADSGDSVYTVTTTAGDFQLTHRETGTRSLDLTAAAGTTVYIALYVQFVVGSATLVEWRAYTEAELFGGSPVAEAGQVVIVGKVVVPGVGPIAASAVTFEHARYAWKDRETGMAPWRQVVQNGDFEDGFGTVTGTDQSIPGYRGEENGSASITLITSGTRGQYSLQMTVFDNVSNARIGPGRFDFSNVFSSGVIPVQDGQLIDVSFWLGGSGVDNYSAGTSGCRLIMQFFDDSGGSIGSDQQVASDPTVHIGTFSFTQIGGIFQSPGDGFMRWYIQVDIDLVSGLSSFNIDDIKIMLQPTPDGERIPTAQPSLRATEIGVIPDNAGSAYDLMNAMIRFVATSTGSTTRLSVLRNELANSVRWLTPFISSMVDTSESSYGLFGTDRTPAQDTVPIALTGYKLLHRFNMQFGHVRIYVSETFGYTVTVNGSWDNSTSMWSKDDTGETTRLFGVSRGSIRVREKNTGAGTWNDSGWDDEVSSSVSGGDFPVYFTPVSRRKFIPLAFIANLGVEINQPTPPPIMTMNLTASGTYSTGASASGPGGSVYVPLAAFLPNGASITEIGVGFTRSGSSTVSIALRRHLPDLVSTGPIPSMDYDEGYWRYSDFGSSEEHVRLSTDGAAGGTNPLSFPHTTEFDTHEYNLEILHTPSGGSFLIKYVFVDFNDFSISGR